jgi:biotin carboxyl carrier protein
MTFEIEVGGRLRSVSVDRISAARYRVVVDHDISHAYVIDAVRVGEFGLSLVVDGDAATSHELQVAPASARDEFLVGLEGRTVPVYVNGRRLRRKPRDIAEHDSGEQTIVAPMPGRIVRVLVGPGDEVDARQPLVVVEAMKMENEMRSPRAGTIKDVTVSAGMSVEAGRVLVTIA